MEVSDKAVYENCLVASPSNIIKPIIKKRVYNKPVILTDISYENYMNDKLELEKFKLPTIKEAVRKYKLRLAGKKSELIERLITHFKSITYAIKIQTVFRRWLVIQMNQLRGPAFKNIKLPQDKIIAPGVIDSTTNFVEHPEVVKNRLVQFSKVVDKEQLMAGTDCGFSTFAGFGNVDENIAYKKLESLVTGANLASQSI